MTFGSPLMTGLIERITLYPDHIYDFFLFPSVCSTDLNQSDIAFFPCAVFVKRLSILMQLLPLSCKVSLIVSRKEKITSDFRLL